MTQITIRELLREVRRAGPFLKGAMLQMENEIAQGNGNTTVDIVHTVDIAAAAVSFEEKWLAANPCKIGTKEELAKETPLHIRMERVAKQNGWALLAEELMSVRNMLNGVDVYDTREPVLTLQGKYRMLTDGEVFELTKRMQNKYAKGVV